MWIAGSDEPMSLPSRKPAALAICLILAAALAAPGCGTTGDESRDEATDEARTTPQPAEPEQPLSPAQERGRELFVDNCGSCHTLESAGTQGAIGPDLDELRPDRERVLAAIDEGPGTMPSGLLSGEDAEDVAEFVSGAGG